MFVKTEFVLLMLFHQPKSPIQTYQHSHVFTLSRDWLCRLHAVILAYGHGWFWQALKAPATVTMFQSQKNIP